MSSLLDLAAQEGLQTVYVHGATNDNVFNHFNIYGRHGQDGDPTGEVRGTGNDAMDNFNHAVWTSSITKISPPPRGRIPGPRLGLRQQHGVGHRAATVYDTTDVSAEDTAFLGFGSDPSYQ